LGEWKKVMADGSYSPR